jgi:hypothetical protein
LHAGVGAAAAAGDPLAANREVGRIRGLGDDNDDGDDDGDDDDDGGGGGGGGGGGEMGAVDLLPSGFKRRKSNVS